MSTLPRTIQYSKTALLTHFRQTPLDKLPEPFKILMQSFPEILTIETLYPIPEKPLPPKENDEALISNQKSQNKPIFTNKTHYIHSQVPQIPQTNQKPCDNYNSFNYKARSVIKAPFSSSGLSVDLGERVWFYIDEQKEIQGPFTTLEMDSWFEKGFLFDELKICHTMTNKFFPLFDLFVERVKSEPNIKEIENGMIFNSKEINLIEIKRKKDTEERKLGYRNEKPRK